MIEPVLAAPGKLFSGVTGRDRRNPGRLSR